MNKQAYPSDIDCVWLASDRNGNVAAFITAGVGPIASEVFTNCHIPIDEIEGKICEMPKTTQARLLVSIKRPDSFVDLAERGLFVYDWTDINRTIQKELKMYEQVALPVQPVTVDKLTPVLATLAKAARLPSVVFAVDMSIDIQRVTV